jgi:hypothetical protein
MPSASAIFPSAGSTRISLVKRRYEAYGEYPDTEDKREKHLFAVKKSGISSGAEAVHI